MDFRLQHPFTMIMAGSSGCGKSTLVSQLLCDIEKVINISPRKIIVCFSEQQELYQSFKDNASCPIEFIDGIPGDLETEPDTLLIIDDLQAPEYLANIRSWFVKKSHHYNTSVIYLVQNIFDKSPEHRTISLNAHYLVIFKNPRDSSQINHLARQMFPKNTQLMCDAYKQATEEPHSYLVVDLKQETEDVYRLRQGLFPLRLFGTHIFIDKETAESAKIYKL